MVATGLVGREERQGVAEGELWRRNCLTGNVDFSYRSPRRAPVRALIALELVLFLIARPNVNVARHEPPSVSNNYPQGERLNPDLTPCGALESSMRR